MSLGSVPGGREGQWVCSLSCVSPGSLGFVVGDGRRTEFGEDLELLQEGVSWSTFWGKRRLQWPRALTVGGVEGSQDVRRGAGQGQDKAAGSTGARASRQDVVVTPAVWEFRAAAQTQPACTLGGPQGLPAGCSESPYQAHACPGDVKTWGSSLSPQLAVLVPWAGYPSSCSSACSLPHG